MDTNYQIDPDLNLREQIAIARKAVRAEIIDPDELLYLARLVVAHDDWIARGGGLPSRCTRNARALARHR